MSGRIPTMFLFHHRTHVHHLNYAIFLLAAVGGYALFQTPSARSSEVAALVYGVALALTFDEFGMWLHLGGSYWQRASVDAVVVVGCAIALIAYAPAFTHFGAKHRIASVLLLV